MIKQKFLIILFVLIAELSFGEVYKWVDEKGVVHFTDDITQIPEKHRKTLEEMEIREEGAEAKTERGSQPKKDEDTDRDRLGRGEEYWKTRVGELKKRIRALQENVEELRIKYNQLTEKFNS